MRQPLRLAAAFAAAAALASCAFNEELGRQQLLLIGETELAQAGQQAWAETLAQGKISPDRAAQARVRQIGERLVQAAGLADRPWEYVVFEDPQANAFALPGGRVGVNTGMLQAVENDDQLAAVIGHELAHVAGNHAAERYSHTAAAQVALGVGQSALGGRMGEEGARRVAALGGVGAQLGLLLPFSRQHELEADRLGVDYMARAGYRPSEAVALWRNLERSRTAGRPPQILSTHPAEATRIAELERYIASRGWR